MDLQSASLLGKQRFASALTWFLSSDIRPSAGFASSRRLLLYGLHQSALSRGRIAFLVTTEAEALEALERTRPGLLIVTPTLEQGDGLTLVHQARGAVEDVRTIILCDSDVDDLVAAGGSGADAVLCEQEFLSEAQPLRTMVIELSLGRQYRSPAVQMALQTAESAHGVRWREESPALTAREQDLIDLWVQGIGDREAAERLGISYGTVRSYGRTLRRKLGVGSRSQVILRAMELGLSRLARRRDAGVP